VRRDILQSAPLPGVTPLPVRLQDQRTTAAREGQPQGHRRQVQENITGNPSHARTVIDLLWLTRAKAQSVSVKLEQTTYKLPAFWSTSMGVRT